MNGRNKLFLDLILVIFLVTRLVGITKNPSSLYWDEASIGYNAYSILETGKDGWGEFLPLHFRAFGEFKLPVYIYSVVLTTKVFGMGELAVRFPAVIYTLGSLILVYLLTKHLFKNDLIALFSAFILSVTPWLFIFSRVGYEATAGLFFYLLTIYLLLLYLDKLLRKKMSIPSMLLNGGVVGLVFILSIYSYNSFRILSPLTFVLIFILYFLKRKGNFLRILRFLILPLFLISVSFIPIYKLYRFDAGASRLQAISLQGTGKEKIIQFSRNYLSHFSYNFLFKTGDHNLRSQMPGFGQLYVVSFPLIILGLYKIFKKRKLEDFILLALILIAPLPGAITKESPHAMRSIAMAPFLSILVSLGLLQLVKSLRSQRPGVSFQDTAFGGRLLAQVHSSPNTETRGILNLVLNFVRKQKIIITSVVVIYLVFFGFYLFKFFSKYPEMSSQDWQYGYKRITEGYGNEFSKYKSVIISDRYAQPYIFILYYLKYDPDLFRKTVRYNPPDKWGFSTVAGFGNFRFKKIEENDFVGDSLIFTTESDKLKSESDSKIFFLDGSTAFWVYKI